MLETALIAVSFFGYIVIGAIVAFISCRILQIEDDPLFVFVCQTLWPVALLVILTSAIGVVFVKFLGMNMRAVERSVAFISRKTERVKMKESDEPSVLPRARMRRR